ncbi:MAG: hypothetical protein U5Q03_01920 [Bacteroidota bacterium]|nr:hypothetical protein [Bacteroidota bacterium]
MSHVYSFFLFSLTLTLWLNYFGKPKLYKAIILGGLLGIIVLIRPTNGLILIPLLLWDNPFEKKTDNVTNRAGIRLLHLASAALAAFIVILPQLIYWKLYTGSWIY